MKLPLTSTQARALQWLTDHGGCGAWMGGKVIAGGPIGNIANFNRPTWAALVERGFIREDGQKLHVVEIAAMLYLTEGDVESVAVEAQKHAEHFAPARNA